MTLRTFKQYKPQIDASAYIDEAATIIGNVSIGKDSSIWPNVVIRGDVNKIKIGANTNIQDGSILHCTHDGPYTKGGQPLIVGDNNTIGHIESHTIIAAGSLVPQGKRLESGYLWLGQPVKKIRKLSPQELDNLQYSAKFYVNLAKEY